MQRQPHIFLVEDEQNLCDTLALNLRLENYEVTIARSGSEALKKFNGFGGEFDLALLDVMLPDINGFDLCKEFKKKKSDLPVIFLTAKAQSSDKVSGLKLGADDYITKPFDLEEVLLRINNLVKRTQKESLSEFKFQNMSINFETFEIKDVKGSLQTLSKREIGLLQLLTSNNNKVISRDEIIDQLWDDNENASSRTIDNYILNFRKYFEENPKEPRHFHSVRGVGYKFTI